MAIVRNVSRTSKGLKTIDMEIALSEYFNARQNLIVPNVEWGAFIHECDLLIITKAGYAYEIEIKVSRADLKKDRGKRHGHVDRRDRIKQLYFAVPEHLLPIDEHIPARAGIISVTRINGRYSCVSKRRAQVSPTACKWSDPERYNVARLGSMRIWTLKKRIVRLSKEMAISSPNRPITPLETAQ